MVLQHIEGDRVFFEESMRYTAISSYSSVLAKLSRGERVEGLEYIRSDNHRIIKYKGITKRLSSDPKLACREIVDAIKAIESDIYKIPDKWKELPAEIKSNMISEFLASNTCGMTDCMKQAYSMAVAIGIFISSIMPDDIHISNGTIISIDGIQLNNGKITLVREADNQLEYGEMDRIFEYTSRKHSGRKYIDMWC